MKRSIDHIVYCVIDLEKAIDKFQNSTGIKPVMGGRHLSKGTKNALVNLGNKCYLEILAVDKESKIEAPRWMGIDLISQPTITRWSLKSTDLEEELSILENYNAKLALVETGQRETNQGQLLNWNMTLPLPAPEVELMPFITDWSKSQGHPTEQLPQKAELLGLFLEANMPDKMLYNCLRSLSHSIEIQAGTTTKITLKIKCPKGIIEF